MYFQKRVISGFAIWAGFLFLSVGLLKVEAGMNEIEAGNQRVSAVEEKGEFTGFDFSVDGKVVAPIRLSSNNFITAGKVETKEESGRKTLVLSALKAKSNTGVKLGAEDYVSITLEQGELYPVVKFRITLSDFNEDKWKDGAGNCPFHFLTCSMQDADAWQMRGWTMATPKADPFPLLIDPHGGNDCEVASKFNRNWSYICPVGAHPVPLIGIWAPERKHYVGYLFQGARFLDHTEKYVATAYCWKEGKDSQFITLAYPYGGKLYQQLVLPKKGDTVSSWFHLIWSLDMPSTKDPNELVHNFIFEKYSAYLPGVPRINDMSFQPGECQKALRVFPQPGSPGIVYKMGPDGDAFSEPGGMYMGGWGWHRELPVEAAWKRGKAAIEKCKKDLEYLYPLAKKFTIGGDECITWEEPLEGKWKQGWDPDNRNVHNSDVWAAAIALVDLYRNEKDPGYLPWIDGLYNWTKHFVFTRNEFHDVPSSPFAIGCNLSCAFLLDYYFTFKYDPQRSQKARDAVDLARAILYRYMPIWPSDNDEADNLDSAFLLEPNSGRDWAGLACANEVHWVLDTITQVYVHTGDKKLNYYMKGILERWYLLYRDEYHRSVMEYPRSAFTEGLGLFDGSGPGRGGRYNFGCADILPFHYPIGKSLLRVTAGEKGAFACNKKGVHTYITDYRYTPDANFSFRVKSKLKEPFDVSITFPFYNITQKPVKIVRGDTQIELVKGEGYKLYATSPSSVYVMNVQDGDIVVVGDVDMKSPVISLEHGFEYKKPTQKELTEGGFEMLYLPVNTEVSLDWEDPSSFAGILPGRHYAFKVPYYIVPPEVSGGPIAVKDNCSFKEPVSGASRIFVVYSEEGSKPEISILLDDGKSVMLPEDAALAWKFWPPCFTRRLWMSSIAIPAGKKVTGVNVKDALLFAFTSWKGDDAGLKTVMECYTKAVEEGKKTRIAEKEMNEFKKQLENIPKGKIAILPPEATSVAATFAGKTGIMEKAKFINTNQLVGSGVFNARNYPVAFYFAGEEYVKTVREDEDGIEAIKRFLSGGGLLVLLPSGPYPMFYGSEKGQKAKTGDPLLPKIGIPMTCAFERPPGPLEMTFNRNQKIIKGLPDVIPFPETGDQRLRPIPPERVTGEAQVTSILTVENYGDAICYIEFTDGELKGGKILYVWSTLLTQEYGQTILNEVFKFVASQFK